jgi:hypothetical protein
MSETVVQSPTRAPNANGAPGSQAPQSPPAPPALPQTAGVPALREQLAQLQVQLAGLKAEWSGLQDQLQSMRIDNPARPPVQAKAADVGVQMAQVQGRIATIEAQIAVAEHANLPGTPGAQTPPPRGKPQMDPDAVTAIFIIFILAVLMPLSIGVARRFWRRGSTPDNRAADPTLTPRLDRLEQAVDTIAIEIERVSEGQRFITKILAERPATAPAASEPAAPGADSSMRALGAGPIEPILVAERQRVRQSNTPH